MSDDRIVIGIHITDRVQRAADVQSVFTDFGCSIKTRLGLHNAGADYCSPAGLVLVEFISGEAKADEMIARLAAIEGVSAQKMVFGR